MKNFPKPWTAKSFRRFPDYEDVLIADPFKNDFSKIIQSKAYRRLAYKTQVMCMPNHSHVRTRLVHTNEVIAVAMAISENLNLNTDLCIAIAAGHDIGHTPYGHIGEDVLSKYGKKEFKHYVNSVVVAQQIERKGKGLNLTYETLEGILNHSRGSGELTVDSSLPQEYSVVMFADKIAYTYSDLNDAIRYGHLKESRVPECALRLGKTQRERTNNTINALVEESLHKGYVQFSEGPVFESFDSLKKFMYAEVYGKIEHSMQELTLNRLLDYFSKDPDFTNISPVLAVSLLTDNEANDFAALLNRSIRPSRDQIKHFGLFEILCHIKDKKIDYTDPDLHREQFIYPG